LAEQRNTGNREFCLLIFSRRARCQEFSSEGCELFVLFQEIPEYPEHESHGQTCQSDQNRASIDFEHGVVSCPAFRRASGLFAGRAERNTLLFSSEITGSKEGVDVP
jgi:hypothetical protein